MLQAAKLLTLPLLCLVIKSHGTPADDSDVAPLDQTLTPISSSYKTLGNIPAIYNYVAESRSGGASKHSRSKGKKSVRVLYKRTFRVKKKQHESDGGNEHYMHRSLASSQNPYGSTNSNVGSKTLRTDHPTIDDGFYDDDVNKLMNQSSKTDHNMNSDQNGKIIHEQSGHSLRSDYGTSIRHNKIYSDNSLDNSNEGIGESFAVIDQNLRNPNKNSEDIDNMDSSEDENNGTQENGVEALIDEEDLDTGNQASSGQGETEDMDKGATRILMVPELISRQFNGVNYQPGVGTEEEVPLGYNMEPKAHIDNFFYQSHSTHHTSRTNWVVRLLMDRICKIGTSLMLNNIDVSKIKQVTEILMGIEKEMILLMKYTTDVESTVNTHDYNTNYHHIYGDIHEQHVDSVDDGNEETRFENDSNAEYVAGDDGHIDNEKYVYPDYDSYESDVYDKQFGREQSDSQQISEGTNSMMSDGVNRYFTGYQVSEPDNIEVASVSINDIIRHLKYIPRSRWNSYIIELRRHRICNHNNNSKGNLVKVYSGEKIDRYNYFKNSALKNYISTTAQRKGNPYITIDFIKKSQ